MKSRFGVASELGSGVQVLPHLHSFWLVGGECTFGFRVEGLAFGIKGFGFRV